MEPLKVTVKFGSKIREIDHRGIFSDVRSMSIEDENSNIVFYLPEAYIGQSIAGRTISNNGALNERALSKINNSLLQEDGFLDAIKKHIMDYAPGDSIKQEISEAIAKSDWGKLFVITEINMVENYGEPYVSKS